ncbi:hypothetical protein ABW19_dt0207022 [Dactylella cylindrospora]|nr:hypothetical protein ABW19_dt0207022 [Dactylella cylindrospora]
MTTQQLPTQQLRLLSLPTEITLEILSYLPPLDLKAILKSKDATLKPIADILRAYEDSLCEQIARRDFYPLRKYFPPEFFSMQRTFMRVFPLPENGEGDITITKVEWLQELWNMERAIEIIWDTVGSWTENWPMPGTRERRRRMDFRFFRSAVAEIHLSAWVEDIAPMRLTSEKINDRNVVAAKAFATARGNHPMDIYMVAELLEYAERVMQLAFQGIQPHPFKPSMMDPTTPEWGNLFQSEPSAAKQISLLHPANLARLLERRWMVDSLRVGIATEFVFMILECGQSEMRRRIGIWETSAFVCPLGPLKFLGNWEYMDHDDVEYFGDEADYDDDSDDDYDDDDNDSDIEGGEDSAEEDGDDGDDDSSFIVEEEEEEKVEEYCDSYCAAEYGDDFKYLHDMYLILLR